VALSVLAGFNELVACRPRDRRRSRRRRRRRRLSGTVRDRVLNYNNHCYYYYRRRRRRRCCNIIIIIIIIIVIVIRRGRRAHDRERTLYNIQVLLLYIILYITLTRE